MLIIALPHSAAQAASAYAHVHSDGHEVLRSASGAAAVLSLHTDEIVAVVPHSRLAWLSVELPPGSHGARLLPVLHGLLEERLLDEPAQLHIATPANAQQVARQGGRLFVCVCDKTWLREVLAPLHAAGVTVQRLVPELLPTPQPLLQVMGTSEAAVGVLCHAKGVQGLPSDMAHWPTFTETPPATWEVWAEPAWVEQVQQALDRAPQLQTAAQRWVQSCQDATAAGWDLAQGEWAQGPRQRAWRTLQVGWQSLRHAPAMRPVRWGLAALLAVQLIGLQALAWQTRHALDAQRAEARSLLTDTFPHVQLVIDAPLQMQREIDALLQTSGAASSRDLEPLLATLAELLPPGQAPNRLDFSATQGLKVQGVALDAERARERLQARGYTLTHDDGDAWLLQAPGGRP